MARARNIKPSFFKNELLGEADPLLGLLFISLWTLADKSGRLEDRPLRIRAETFPYRENININGYLTELLALGFIERYESNGIKVIEIVNFTKHQTPHSTEKVSELPSKPIAEPITLINGSASVNGHINVLIPDSLLLIPDSLSELSNVVDNCNSEEVLKEKTHIQIQISLIAKELTAIGMTYMNLTLPDFIAAIESGVTAQEFVSTALEQKGNLSKFNFKYVLATIIKRRQSVAKDMHKGAMPTAPPKTQSIHDKRSATAKAMFGDITNANDNAIPIYDVSDCTTETNRPLIS